MTNDWARDGFFYHIYPLGLCGAPARNDFSSAPEPRLRKIEAWIPHIAGLGCTAVWLGPVFESTAHGYDTADYARVDRRLGTNADLSALVAAFHAAGIRVVLDGVFNHVGRDFPQFRDLVARGAASAYRDWFCGIDFSKRSAAGDPFAYEGWHGFYDLVRLNLANPAVRDHLFGAVAGWLAEFDIDGLRLDAADCVDLGFQRDLARLVRAGKPDAFLFGEIVAGDYRTWANRETLDSVTNYECYKGLWSSMNDRNLFEIAWSLNRQFGPEGLYRGIPLYNFADNHDVDRVASILADRTKLYPLYLILCTMPGIPSVYYGSEWGIPGRHANGSDAALRPALVPGEAERSAGERDLAGAVTRFIGVRRASAALRRGSYRQLAVESERLAFAREADGERVVVAVNAAGSGGSLRIPVGAADGMRFTDLLNPGRSFTARAGVLECPLDPCWGRILRAGE